MTLQTEPPLREREEKALSPEACMGSARGLGQDGCSSRMSAHSAILDKIQRLRREADDLEILLGSLPRTLPDGADQILHALLFTAYRKGGVY